MVESDIVVEASWIWEKIKKNLKKAQALRKEPSGDKEILQCAWNRSL